MDKLLNIEELLYVFKKKFWIIILITAITTSLGVYKVSKLQPSYIATAKVFIGNSEDMIELYTTEELYNYSKFVSIFNELSKIDGFFDDTLKKNNINKSSLEVAYGLSFSSSENTPMVTISYSSGVKEDIEKTLNAVCEELIEKLKGIMPEANPTIISEASAATIYPNKRKLPMVGFVSGVIISVMIILILDYLDDRIISKKQLNKVLPIPVLGDIPTHERQFRREDKDVCSKQDAEIIVGGSVQELKN